MVMGYYVVSLNFSKKSRVSTKSFREMYPKANISHKWPHWQKSTKSKLGPKVVCG